MRISSILKSKKIDLLIGIILTAIFCFLFMLFCIKTIQCQEPAYDDGYNATVAANVMRYGEYRVSYPSHTVFYNMISTGETVLLPAALLFRLWGINSVTTSMPAVLYGLACIVAAWVLFALCLKDFSNRVYSLAAIGSIILVLADGLFIKITTRLLGETAAILFVLMGLIFLKLFYDKRKASFMVLAGAMFACSFLTKSATIFIIVTIFGLLFWESLVMKSLSFKDFLAFAGGFILGFAILDLYKLVQLGGVRQYVHWWLNEWHNILDQSGGLDTSYSISDKFNYLSEIFGGCHPGLCWFITILPIVIYLVLIIKKLFRKKDDTNFGLRVMLFAGICGASMIVYFVFLGGSGLVYARRHEINEFLVRMCAIYIGLGLVSYLTVRLKTKKYVSCIGITALIVLILASTVHINTVKSNCRRYYEKYDSNIQYADQIQQFLVRVDQLPEDAVLYCAGWWQEPNVSLYLDRDMRDIYEVINGGADLADNRYFIVGNLIEDVSIEDIENATDAKLTRLDVSEISNEETGDSLSGSDFERFAIYKIE